MGAVSSAWYPRVENPYATYFSKPPGTKDYGIYAAIDSRSDKIVWHKRSSWPMQIGGGALTTAGGLLFYTEADGTFRANNARTGEPLWQFQTGLLPSALGGPGGVPAATYEAGGTQFVLAPVDKGLWAFKLGGNLPQRAALPPPPTEFGFSGIVKQIPADGSGEIAIAARRSAQVPGVEFMDEYAFVPTRARVRAGVSVKWTNYGVLPHTIVADDGSWATTEIMPGQSASVTISKPGSYVFFSREYPWSRGQIIVQ
jgi:alcohol dehydrogenase (cytochrome c)